MLSHKKLVRKEDQSNDEESSSLSSEDRLVEGELSEEEEQLDADRPRISMWEDDEFSEQEDKGEGSSKGPMKRNMVCASVSS